MATLDSGQLNDDDPYHHYGRPADEPPPSSLNRPAQRGESTLGTVVIYGSSFRWPACARHDRSNLSLLIVSSTALQRPFSFVIWMIRKPGDARLHVFRDGPITTAPSDIACRQALSLRTENHSNLAETWVPAMGAARIARPGILSKGLP
jgi:hypothetical protein